MRLTIVDHQHLHLDTAGPGLDVRGGEFGPLEMLAASLALCTASVVTTYAETANLPLGDFAIDLQWEYVDDPYRVGRYALTLRLPATVPPARHRAMLRAVETCTVHNTLLHPPQMTSAIEVAGDGAARQSPAAATGA